MEPITREEMYLAAAAGEYSGELPEPKTRLEYYLKKIAENGGSVSPAAINTAIADYINNHIFMHFFIVNNTFKFFMIKKLLKNILYHKFKKRQVFFYSIVS